MKTAPIRVVHKYAYNAARRVNLTVPCSQAIADRVVQRVILGGESLSRVVDEEIAKEIKSKPQ